MYEEQTESVIRERMLGNVSSDLDQREGSFIHDGISPAAIELALAYIELDRVIGLGFAQTTYGQYLDYRAGEHGLTRKASTKATGQVTISGSQGAVVPKGSLFATGSGVQFMTVTEVTIDEAGQVVSDIEAVEAGLSGNVPGSTITEIPVSIQGVTGAKNLDALEGGTDAETDAALIERLLEKVREPATSGNTAHYSQWAQEVPGVGDAKVFPLWDGVGTVKVVIITSDKDAAPNDLVLSVQNHIDPNKNGDGSGEAPIGAKVTVESAEPLSVNISVTVKLDTDIVLANAQAAFESAIVDYLVNIAFKQDYVSYAQVGVLLFNIPGVLDYENLTLNDGTTNVPIGDVQVAVKGTVTFSE